MATQVVNIRKAREYDVYVGRPSSIVTLEIEGRASEAFWVVFHEPNGQVASIAESAAKSPGRMVMIPSQVGGGGAHRARLGEDGLPAGSVGFFVESGSLVSVFSASPGSGGLTPADELRRSALSAEGSPLFNVYVGQSVFPCGCLGAGSNGSSSEEPVVASDAESTGSEWLVAARGRALLTAQRGGSRGHSKHDSTSHVSSPFKWGNPFSIGRDGTREEVISKYRVWLGQQPHLLASLGELRGLVLGCWCTPEACHAEVLAEMADRE